MPCRSDVDDLREAIADANRATRAVCDIVRRARKLSLWGRISSGVNKDTLDWVTEHDKGDAKRQKREEEERQRKEAQEKALAKLSKAERKLLGLG